MAQDSPQRYIVKSVLSAARTATSLIGYISIACLWKLGYDPKLIYFSFALLAGVDTLSLCAHVYFCFYSSPIARFPGRKIAALTLWYEFYYDVIKGGEYIWEIEKMHKQYGPIIRINPYELHVSDPQFLKQLYSSSTKNVEKWTWSAAQFGSYDMTSSTVQHGLHKLRRQAYSNLFSKQSIRSLEPLIQSVVDTLYDQMEKRRGTGEPIHLGQIYAALTQDIITEYCFANNKNTLLMPGFGPSYDTILTKAKLCPTLKQFPLLVPAMSYLPTWFLDLVFPLLNSLKSYRQSMLSQVHQFLATRDTLQRKTHTTVFDAILDDPDLPASEKTPSRLAWESQLLLGAGTLTTAHVLQSTSYHLLTNPPILHKLTHELHAAAAEHSCPIPLHILEHLPYLNAVIAEGLRISNAVMHRLQRVHPDTPLHYRDWTIPPGIPVGMSPPLIQYNETLFPNPHTFDPERWMPFEETKTLQAYIFVFGKGSRICAGRELAYTELYMALAKVFGGMVGGELRVWETERERDVDVVKDYFVGSVGEGGRGVRVVVGGGLEKKV
ncbi:MAG: hypothetical protein Q9178_005247 [Gyalolechia marmorata]